VAAQSSHGARVESDPAGASGGLGLRDLKVVVDHDEGLTDCEPAAVQVEVGPAQPEDFAAAHAGEGGQPPGRCQPIVLDAVEELT
jgi:hypothetical protein